jgi:hypothetical protein
MKERCSQAGRGMHILLKGRRIDENCMVVSGINLLGKSPSALTTFKCPLKNNAKLSVLFL